MSDLMNLMSRKELEAGWLADVKELTTLRKENEALKADKVTEWDKVLQDENKALQERVGDLKRLLVVAEDRSGRNLIRAEQAEAQRDFLHESMDIRDSKDAELNASLHAVNNELGRRLEQAEAEMHRAKVSNRLLRSQLEQALNTKE